MKIKEIICENRNDIISVIENDCHYWVEELGGINNVLFNSPVYRGRENLFSNNEEMIKEKCPTNRQPVSTNLRLHTIADNWFLNNENIGLRFRSKALFVVGDLDAASIYGSPAILAPIGDYDYCWSPRISDLFAAFSGLPLTVSKDQINQILDDGKYQFNFGIKQGIKLHHEIMINCKEAWLINPEKIHQI